MQRGDLVAGRFLVEDIAGEGGMSVVFRARDEQSGGAVALKFLRGATRQADRVRFDREARILSELRHPGIVSYVAHGQAMGGRYGRGPASLDVVCWALGMPSPKEVMDGSMVHTFFAKGDMATIAEYNAGDVRATTAVYQRVRDGLLRYRDDW